MNKKLLIGSITAALILGGTFAVGASELPIFDLKTNKLVKYEKEYIPEELAKTIALNEVNGTVENVEIEKENGHFYYEVEIDKDNIDYDVFVEAYTGKIAYVRVENDNNIKNMNEVEQVESIKNTNKVEKVDSHDDGTKEATIENKPQAPSTSKPAISKAVQNQQVHDDDDWDDDRDDDDDNDRDDDNDNDDGD